MKLNAYDTLNKYIKRYVVLNKISKDVYESAQVKLCEELSDSFTPVEEVVETVEEFKSFIQQSCEVINYDV